MQINGIIGFKLLENDEWIEGGATEVISDKTLRWKIEEQRPLTDSNGTHS